jgi:hypothetical protein
MPRLVTSSDEAFDERSCVHIGAATPRAPAHIEDSQARSVDRLPQVGIQYLRTWQLLRHRGRCQSIGWES